MKLEYFSRNDNLLADGHGYRKTAMRNKVNLNWWHTEYGSDIQNLGDRISEIVFNYLCKLNNIDKDKIINKTKHLYAIGSILFFENQDATVWGTGCMHEISVNFNTVLHQKYMRHLDVRAVRGPKTREELIKLGIQCPEIYGDPAILMPLIYKPMKKSNVQTILIAHYKDMFNLDTTEYPNVQVLDMLTNNWKEKIDIISSAQLVVSSSLHGLVIAESYKVPAILLQPEFENDLFKYEDYYLGTGRAEYPMAKSIDEALHIDLNEFKTLDVKPIQKRLMNAFPVDLWESE